MLKLQSKVRKWGRSFGVVLPKEKIKKEGIKADDNVTLLIVKKSNALKETFGTLKIGNTQKLLDQIDREGWDE